MIACSFFLIFIASNNYYHRNSHNGPRAIPSAESPRGVILLGSLDRRLMRGNIRIGWVGAIE
jgi:hypothetical protein